MYPSMHHHADGHPGSIAATGIPEHIPKQPYVPPPLLSPHAVTGRVPERWSTGLCHCCDDPVNCFITCFCPCITFGQIAEIVNKGSSSCAESGTKYALLLLTGFACLYSCFYRSKLRGQYDLKESPCVDCLVHFCCETCALCQEYRELRDRGYDMGIGWEANMDRQQRGVIVAPIITSGMRR